MIRLWHTILLAFVGGFMIVPHNIVLTIIGSAFVGMTIGLSLGRMLGYKD